MSYRLIIVIFTFLATFSITISLTNGQSGNCTFHGEPTILRNFAGSMILADYGDYGILSSTIDGEIQEQSFSLNLSTKVVMERQRTLPNNRCSIPRYSDPWTPTSIDGKPYSPIIANYTRDMFNCYSSMVEYVRENVKIHRLQKIMTLVTNPQFTISTSYEFAETELIVIPSNNVTFTGGIPYEYHW
jgi:hypothetical protein